MSDDSGMPDRPKLRGFDIWAGTTVAGAANVKTFEKPDATDATVEAKPKPRRKPKKQGSAFTPKYGDLTMRVYPVTETDLFQLAAISAFAVISFSGAASCLSFALDIHKDLTLSIGVPESTLAFWSAVRAALAIGTAVLALIGVGFIFWRGMAVNGIKNRAKFEDDETPD